MSRTTRAPGARCQCRVCHRKYATVAADDPRPSDARRLASTEDSSPDDVPLPSEIDPAFFDHLNCDDGPWWDWVEADADVADEGLSP